MGTDFKSVPARALPAGFLRSRPIFATFKTFYEVVKIAAKTAQAGGGLCIADPDPA